MIAILDEGIAMNSTLKIIIDRFLTAEIPIILFSDSYSLNKYLFKLGITKEKKLMIDIMTLRQSYERIAFRIRWIRGKNNRVNAMTKLKPNIKL